MAEWEAAMDWRATFGFDGQDVSFSEVHDRYRAKMLEVTDFSRVRHLNEALEAARVELGTGQPS